MCPAIAGQSPVFHPFSLARFARAHRVRRERYQPKYFFLGETKAPSSGFQNRYSGDAVEMMVKRVDGGWAFSQSLAR